MRLVGECNKCGLCCAPYDHKLGKRIVCEYLVIEGKLGEPEATYCAKYAERYQGMPTHLLDQNTGEVVRPSYCCKDSAEETWAIMVSGLNKGCSLKVAVETQDVVDAAVGESLTVGRT